MITEQGRLAWQVATDYGQRSLVETTIGRYKVLIGPRLRARGFAAQLCLGSQRTQASASSRAVARCRHPFRKPPIPPSLETIAL
jgi:hypothetical protein